MMKSLKQGLLSSLLISIIMAVSNTTIIKHNIVLSSDKLILKEKKINCGIK